MSNTLILSAIASVVAVVILLLRTNSAVVFFGLCAGSVLASFISEDAVLLSDSFIKNNEVMASIIRIGLVALPAVLAALFFRKSQSKSKLIFNLVPAIASGLLAVSLTVPLLPPGLSHNLMLDDGWIILQRYQTTIVLGGVATSLLLMWFESSKGEKHKKH